MNNVRHETRRTFRKRERMPEKTNKLQTSSKNKYITDLYK